MEPEEPKEIKREIEKLKEKHEGRKSATPRYLQKAKPKTVGQMEVNEKVEALEYILHCPECGKNSSYFGWNVKQDTAICPVCETESLKSRIKIVQEIKTSLTRLK